jgi:hypothetical protein
MKGCRPFTGEEVILLQQSFGGIYAARDKALFLLGVKSGFRISELLSPRLGDVSQHGHLVDRMTVPRRHMKSKREGRTVLLHPEANAALAARLLTLRHLSHHADDAALVGIDWADTKHDVCLRATGAAQEEYGVMGHVPEAIDHGAKALADRFSGSKIAVCLEPSKGSLIDALWKGDHFVLYPITPRTLAKFREALAPSGKKDEPAEAQLLLERVRKHREKLKPGRPADQHPRTLQFLVEHRRQWVEDNTRLTNRLTSVLKGHFPQVLCRFAALDAP